MGFDVYGNDPTHHEGEYFRTTVDGWNALWAYCREAAPNVCALVKRPHTNEGDGLAANQSKKLAEVLWREFTNGKMKAYAERRVKTAGTLYPFSIPMVMQFSRFLDRCGGFRIC